jgi:DNA-binding transcriptional regulator YiaG
LIYFVCNLSLGYWYLFGYFSFSPPPVVKFSVTKKTAEQKNSWDGGSIQSLRLHLGLTQSELSEQLGTRQQTISEWETGMYRPRGASAKLLSIIAEKARFKYDVSSPKPAKKP